MNTNDITKFYIKDMFKSAIRNAKKGNKYVATEYLTELRGMTVYMHAINTISRETADKIFHLITLIRRKYDLY